MSRLLELLRADRDEPSIEFTFTADWQSNNTEAEPDQDVRSPESARLDSNQHEQPIDLHPEARANFDLKAVSLLDEVVSSPLDSGLSEPTSPIRAQQLAKQLPNHAVRAAVEVFRDSNSIVVARSFTNDGMITGLQGRGYSQLRRLAESLQRTAALRDIVSAAVLEQFIFEWVRDRVLGTTSSPMSDQVLASVSQELAEYEVILPLFRVELPDSIRIGRVTLRPITSDDFARWELAAGPGRLSTDARAAFLHQRKIMQGFAAAAMRLTGEQQHVLETAKKEADEAVSILRLFSSAMISPRARTFCALFGRHNLESTSHLVADLNRLDVTLGSDLDSGNDYIWRLDVERLRIIREEALDELLQGLYDGRNTDFQREVRAALFLYSQSGLKSQPTEKLLTILIPLESLLLKNQSEPITENLAMRLAFAIGETLEDRKKIVEVVRSAYKFRSGYVHHLQQIDRDEDIQVLQEFMEYTWTFFLRLGKQTIRYKDRTEYLSDLDERKLT